VTLRIEAPSWDRPLIRLSGRIQSQNLAELRRYLDAPGFKPTLDLAEVNLVDVEAVRFLIACEDGGIELLHCSAYIRQWMAREQDHD
jgi:hypothetical protein